MVYLKLQELVGLILEIKKNNFKIAESIYLHAVGIMLNCLYIDCASTIVSDHF